MKIPKNNISQFLHNQLSINKYILDYKDTFIIKNNGIEEYIFRQIVRSQFRRTSINPSTREDVSKKIKASVLKNEPISFSLPFGAYKNWKLWSYPEPEWAEIFNINYLLRYSSPIAAAYDPGVILNYSYGDNVMDTVSNMPKEDTTRYIKIFKDLLIYFSVFIPKNIALNCVCINDFYSSPLEHRKELEKNFNDNLNNWENKFSEEERNNKINSARRNLMIKGEKDLSHLDDDELEKEYIIRAMWCEAHDNLSKRRGFNKFGKNIELVFVRGPSLAVHIGSCDTSSHHFWVGTGIIEVRKSKLLQRIVSQEILDSLLNTKKAEFVSVDTPFLNFSNNYQSISIWDNR